MKYACIEANRTLFPVKMMCRVLGISRSGFYAARKRAPSERDRENECLLLEIRAVHRESKQRYGSPRVFDAMRAKVIGCGKKPSRPADATGWSPLEEAQTVGQVLNFL